MALLRKTLIICTLLNLFGRVNTQTADSTSTLTTSTATQQAPTTASPSSPSMTTLPVPSTSVNVTAATLSSFTGATINTTVLSSTLSTNTTTAFSTFSENTTSATAILSTNTTTTSTVIFNNDTSNSPSITVSTNTYTPISSNATSTSETNTTVSPNVTSASELNTTVSLNDTTTNSTVVPGMVSPSSTAVNASTTTSLPPSTTSMTAPPSTPLTPQANTVVMVLTAVNGRYHPARVNFTLDDINRLSKSLCKSQTTQSVIVIKYTSRSDYFYYVNDIIETTTSSSSSVNNFVCRVDDLPNLSTRTYGNITCSRDAQSCTMGDAARMCASVTMVTNQCSVPFHWPSDQTVTITYNPKVLNFTCKDANISCSANIDVSLVTGATTITTSSTKTPTAENLLMGDGEKGYSGVILGVILSLLVVAIAVVFGFLWWRQRNSKQRGSVQFHNDGSHPPVSQPMGLRIGEKRTLQRLQSSNSDDTEYEFASVSLSPTSPSPQANSGANDASNKNVASDARYKYATNDQENKG